MRAVAALLILFVAGCGAKPAADPNGRKAAEWALEQGGTVLLFETEAPLKRGRDLPTGDVSIERIDLNTARVKLPRNRERRVNDADLDQLEGLKNLKSLGLHGAVIGSAGVDKIVALTSLEELELSYTNLDDAGLEKIKTLPKLAKLFIHHTKVSKAAAEKFAKDRPKVAIHF